MSSYRHNDEIANKTIMSVESIRCTKLSRTLATNVNHRSSFLGCGILARPPDNQSICIQPCLSNPLDAQGYLRFKSQTLSILSSRLGHGPKPSLKMTSPYVCLALRCTWLPWTAATDSNHFV